MLFILCFGDSITYSAWDSEGGWVARVRKKIDKICIDSDLQSYILTYNLGISSDTTERLLERFDIEMESHSKEPGDSLVIISIGTNDSILKSGGKHNVEPTKFEANIRALIAKAKRSALDIVFVGSLPVDESKTTPYHDQPDISSTNRDIGRYDHAVQQICKELGVNFIPLFTAAMANGYTDWLSSDGVHPNDQGHSFIAGKVWAYLEDNNWVVG